MQNITIEMSEAEMFALDMIAINKQEWADYLLTNRARVAKEELKTKPEWAQAIGALVSDGGDASDDWAVLLKGKELGLFESAADAQARNLVEQQTGIAPEVATEPTAQHVLQKAMLLKMALVKAPAAEAFKDIVAAGVHEGLRLMRAKDKAPWTDEQAARSAELEQFDAAIDYLDHAAQLIAADVESGSITEIEAIATDERWTLPSV